MSNKPFDRTIINPLEKPLADDVNQLETNFDHALRFFISKLLSGAAGTPLDGFLGNSFQVVPASPADMTVSVTAGLGFQLGTTTEIAIDTIIGLNDLEKYKPLVLLSNLQFSVPTAPGSPNSRIDIIEVLADFVTTDSSTRQVFNASIGQFEPNVVKKTMQWAMDGRVGSVNAPSNSTAVLSYKVGEAANPGTAPTVTPGYIKIAEVSVGSDVVTITAADITDNRFIMTEQEVWVHWPATTGYGIAGTPGPVGGGFSTAGAGDTWNVPIGAGLEEGDVIDAVWGILEDNTGPFSPAVHTGNLRFVEMDLSTLPAPVYTANNLGNETISFSAAGINAIVFDETTDPTAFPYTWGKGYAGVFSFDPVNDVQIYSVVAKVRRPIIRRAS